MQQEQEERAERVKQVDKDYQRAIKSSGQTNSPATADPWKKVRPPTPSKEKKAN
jgi:hypothetical protein